MFISNTSVVVPLCNSILQLWVHITGPSSPGYSDKQLMVENHEQTSTGRATTTGAQKEQGLERLALQHSQLWIEDVRRGSILNSG